MRLMSSCERKGSVELELGSRSLEEINQDPIGARDDLADHLHRFVRYACDASLLVSVHLARAAS